MQPHQLNNTIRTMNDEPILADPASNTSALASGVDEAQIEPPSPHHTMNEQRPKSTPARPVWYPFPCGERPMTTLQYIMGWRPRPRNGKIARLPKAIRDHINQMIEDGVPYRAIIDRLKDSGTPPPIAISEMNLSNWRQGGYQDWRRQQQKNEVQKRLSAALPALVPSASGEQTTENDEQSKQTLECGDPSPLSVPRLVAHLPSKPHPTKPDQPRPILSIPDQKMKPKHHQDQIRQQVVQMLDQELLGIRHPVDPTGDPLRIRPS